MVSASMRAATCASSRGTKVPETNRRSTNSRLTAGTTVTAGGSTTRGCSAAAVATAGAGQAPSLLGAIFAIIPGGRAQGTTTLAAQTPPSATAATTGTMIKA